MQLGQTVDLTLINSATADYGTSLKLEKVQCERSKRREYLESRTYKPQEKTGQMMGYSCGLWSQADLYVAIFRAGFLTAELVSNTLQL